LFGSTAAGGTFAPAALAAFIISCIEISLDELDTGVALEVGVQ
jgi:hypothetical protein